MPVWGTGELLDILQRFISFETFCQGAKKIVFHFSVVDDFRVPLKVFSSANAQKWENTSTSFQAENKQLLLKVILPLHKPSKCFGQYHSKVIGKIYMILNYIFIYFINSAGGQGCTIHQVGCLADGTRHPDNAQMLAQAKLHKRSQSCLMQYNKY
jgi:hypothetical protein